VLAEALGLEMGTHRIKPVKEEDAELQYKYLTTNTEFTNRLVQKRTVEVVTPEEMISNSKKPKLSNSFNKANSLQEKSADIEANVNSSNSNFSAIMKSPSKSSVVPPKVTRSPPSASKVRIVTSSAAVGNTDSTSKAAYSGKSVSLLSLNSLSPSKSLQNQSDTITSYINSNSSVNSVSAQNKIIIVSGMKSGVPKTIAKANVSQSNIVNVTQANTNNSANSNCQTTNIKMSSVAPGLTGGQIITLTNGDAGAVNATSRGISLLQPSAGGNLLGENVINVVHSTPQASIQNTVNVMQQQQQQQQQYFIKFSPQANGQEFLQPKLVLNEMGLLNALQTSVATSQMSQSLIQTDSSGTIKFINPSMVSSQNTDHNNVLYTFANSDTNSTNADDLNLMNSEYSTFMVDENLESETIQESTSMQSTDENSPQDYLEQNLLQNGNSEEKLGNGDEIVLSSNKPEQYLCIPSPNTDNNTEFRSEEVFEEVDMVTVAASDSNDLELEGEPLTSDLTNSGVVLDGEEGFLEGLGLQLPATSILQTEDGHILIQNADGTTLQLQGSDGQPVSLETVQALLGIDPDTQFITENS